MARGVSHAFRKGFLLGGIIAGAAVVWNAPQAGARTREQILETVEGALFKVLDIPATLNRPHDGAGTGATMNSGIVDARPATGSV